MDEEQKIVRCQQDQIAINQFFNEQQSRDLLQKINTCKIPDIKQSKQNIDKIHKKKRPLLCVPVQEALDQHLDFILLIGIDRPVIDYIIFKISQSTKTKVKKLINKFKVFTKGQQAKNQLHRKKVSVITRQSCVQQIKLIGQNNFWQLIRMYVIEDNVSSIAKLYDIEEEKYRKRQQSSDEYFSQIQTTTRQELENKYQQFQDDLQFIDITNMQYTPKNQQRAETEANHISKTWQYVQKYPNQSIKNVQSLLDIISESNSKTTNFIILTGKYKNINQAHRYHQTVSYMNNNQYDVSESISRFDQFISNLYDSMASESLELSHDYLNMDTQNQQNEQQISSLKSQQYQQYNTQNSAQQQAFHQSYNNYQQKFQQDEQVSQGSSVDQSNQDKQKITIKFLKKLQQNKDRISNQNKLIGILRLYTEQKALFYEPINKYFKYFTNKPSKNLYLRHPIKMIMESAHILFNAQLPSIIEYASKCKNQQLVLYRGFILPDTEKRIFDLNPKGMILQHKGFLSTSLDLQIAAGFTTEDHLHRRFLLKIIVPAQELSYYLTHPPTLGEGLVFLLKKYSVKGYQNQVLLNILNFYEFISCGKLKMRSNNIQRQYTIYTIKFINPLKLVNKNSTHKSPQQKSFSYIFKYQLSIKHIINQQELLIRGKYTQAEEYLGNQIRLVLHEIETSISYEQLVKRISNGHKQQKELHSKYIKKAHGYNSSQIYSYLKSVQRCKEYIQQLLAQDTQYKLQPNKVIQLISVCYHLHNKDLYKQNIRQASIYMVISLTFLDLIKNQERYIQTTTRKIFQTHRVIGLNKLSQCFYLLGLIQLSYHMFEYNLSYCQQLMKGSHKTTNLHNDKFFMHGYLFAISKYLKIGAQLRKKSKLAQFYLTVFKNKIIDRRNINDLYLCRGFVQSNDYYAHLMQFLDNVIGEDQPTVMIAKLFQIDRVHPNTRNVSKIQLIKQSVDNVVNINTKRNERNRLLFNLFGTVDQKLIRQTLNQLAIKKQIINSQMEQKSICSINLQQISRNQFKNDKNMLLEQENQRQSQLLTEVYKQFFKTKSDKLITLMCMKVRRKIRREQKQNIRDQLQIDFNKQELQKQQKLQALYQEQKRNDMKKYLRLFHIKKYANQFENNAIQNGIYNHQSFTKLKQLIEDFLNQQDRLYMNLLIIQVTLIKITSAFKKLKKTFQIGKGASQRSISLSETSNQITMYNRYNQLPMRNEDIIYVYNLIKKTINNFESTSFGCTQHLQLLSVYLNYFLDFQYNIVNYQQKSILSFMEPPQSNQNSFTVQDQTKMFLNQTQNQIEYNGGGSAEQNRMIQQYIDKLCQIFELLSIKYDIKQLDLEQENQLRNAICIVNKKLSIEHSQGYEKRLIKLINIYNSFSGSKKCIDINECNNEMDNKKRVEQFMTALNKQYQLIQCNIVDGIISACQKRSQFKKSSKIQHFINNICNYVFKSSHSMYQLSKAYGKLPEFKQYIDSTINKIRCQVQMDNIQKINELSPIFMFVLANFMTIGNYQNSIQQDVTVCACHLLPYMSRFIGNYKVMQLCQIQFKFVYSFQMYRKIFSIPGSPKIQLNLRSFHKKRVLLYQMRLLDNVVKKQLRSQIANIAIIKRVLVNKNIVPKITKLNQTLKIQNLCSKLKQKLKKRLQCNRIEIKW